MTTKIIKFIFLTAAVIFSQGCGQTTEPKASLRVVDIPQTSVRRQIAGNCGLQAAASWVESLHLQATGEKISISDNYWSWWLLYDSFLDENGWFLNPSVDVSLSGIQKMFLNWAPHAKVLYEHGLMVTGGFMPDESSPAAATKIADAWDKILAQKRPGGSLSTPEMRTPENIRRQLDDAFGIRMSDLEAKALKAFEFVVGRRPDGSFEYLSSLVDGSKTSWSSVVYPMVFGKNPAYDVHLANRRNSILKRVMIALNNHKPVMMEVSTSLSAIDKKNATFRADLVRDIDLSDDGGAHMVLITDYAVDNIPGIGSVGEGDVPDDIKKLAPLGRLHHFRVKNSWGTNRPSVGTVDGYHRFESSYLNDSLQWGYCTNNGEKYCSSLLGFVLPPEN